ncbi:MAG TPA: hypothetical protein VLA48_03355 [Nitrososphaeraceae archaeon]|nr:hypothetical protein [Nitrososphaeraceae archaeon]
MKRLTTEEFKEKAIMVHGNTFDYSMVEYVNSQTKVKILCERHGMFEQVPNNHINGQGCLKCGHEKVAILNRNTKEQFIKKAENTYNGYFDYSESDYVDSTTKITIICRRHGKFFQTPDGHLAGNGCKKCVSEKPSTLRSNTEDFITKSNILHNNTYTYPKTEYIKNNVKVSIFCGSHGEFFQTPNAHLGGRGCKECSKIKRYGDIEKNTTDFIKDSNKIHGGMYSYPDTLYVNLQKKVKIFCEIHGNFLQSPSKHLKGQGCRECSLINRGYSRTDYIKKAKGRICTFYTLICFNENEEFYKIGITMRSVQERYPDIRTMPYNYEIISEIYGEAGSIWDMEKENMKKLNTFKYKPEIEFGGSKRECFTQHTLDEAE